MAAEKSMAADKAGRESSAAAWEAEYDQVRDLLSRKFMPLRFPPALEPHLQRTMLSQAMNTIRENYGLLFMMVVAITLMLVSKYIVGGIWIAPPEDLHLLLVNGFGSALGLLAMVMAVQQPWLQRFFVPVTLCVITGLLVMVNLTTASLLDESLRQGSTYVVIFVLQLVYGVSSLPLAVTAFIGIGGMLLSSLLIWGMDLRFDWWLFAQYAGLANFVGIGTGYVIEVRQRRLFLQSRLLDLERRQLNRLSERLVQLAREDGLTGLANRRHFNDSFLIEWERARREHQPLSLVLADVDHFKAYNDNHGHIAGDKALVQVGGLMRQVATRPTDLAARYGGEEFVMLLPNTDTEGAQALATQLLQAVDRAAMPHKASSVGRHVTLSLGVATVVPDDHMAPMQLIDRADKALYAAKTGGRHRVMVAEPL
ncbi:GGDEF domain-containing protein [Perlucidibaca piscinae]|uniref:GGDEF domain-containing protein n=1 Tax=Perlucidibaca piscinae TaxID=392589 RepID=UPI00040109BE|nr:GGDEF domain-containing protein [Perlucidibaca piscinae]